MSTEQAPDPMAETIAPETLAKFEDLKSVDDLRPPLPTGKYAPPPVIDTPDLLSEETTVGAIPITRPRRVVFRSKFYVLKNRGERARQRLIAKPRRAWHRDPSNLWTAGLLSVLAVGILTFLIILLALR